jgi:hypothetical protein
MKVEHFDSSSADEFAANSVTERMGLRASSPLGQNLNRTYWSRALKTYFGHIGAVFLAPRPDFFQSSRDKYWRAP